MDYHYEVSNLHIKTIFLACFTLVEFFSLTFSLLPGSSPCCSFFIVAFCLWQLCQCPCASSVMLFFPTTVLKAQFLSFPPLTVIV